ncbi:MAG: helix-turn-helix transcriptional regulator [Anaerolineaceae bacterium]|nr:helix-turn-helix transcriptional regulator [Anaerolineaceae bacterium]
MGHLQIAYHLFVIIIGFIALSIAGFWAKKTRESYLRDFCILYAFFTGALIFTLLHQYLILNVADYSIDVLYWIIGIKQVLNFAIVVAAIQLFTGIYQIKARKKITLAMLALMIIAYAFMFSPIGATLDRAQQGLQLGVGYQIAASIYFLSFTFMLIIGYGFLTRVLHTKMISFVIGLLIFASVGYIETLFSMLGVINLSSIILTQASDFFFSSIPYALYGIFLVYYFLNAPVPTSINLAQVPEIFFEQYGITDREREIIQKVMLGMSNADVGEALFISLATVKTHLHNIYQKLEIDSRYELIAKIRSAQ